MIPEGQSAGRQPTIYDVARAAGVAASTVSRTFSRPGRVNSETAARIRQAAADLGYHANSLARALPAGRAEMIAVVGSDITNPFYAPIIRGAQNAAAKAGFTMMLADIRESGALEREVVERTLPAVDGIVLASPRMSQPGIRVSAKVKPIVVLNRPVAGVSGVITDNQCGVRRAVEHLTGLGHRDITYLAGPEASWADGTRWRALRESCLERGIRVRRLGPFLPTVTGGMRAADDVRATPTSAVLAYNDQLAIGLIGALTRHGVGVPDEVSVIGFDDIFASALVTPALTTVAAPLPMMGATAVTNLIALIGGARSRSDEPVVLPVKLVVRDSTAPRRRHTTSSAPGAGKVPEPTGAG